MTTMVRYTLFTIIVCLVLPQSVYSLPLKLRSIRGYSDHGTDILNKSVLSETTLKRINSDSAVPWSTIADQVMNTTTVYSSTDPVRSIINIISNITENKARSERNETSASESLPWTRFQNYNVGNIIATWAGRQKKRISQMTGKMASLFPHGTVYSHLQRIFQPEHSDDFNSHSISLDVRKANRSNTKAPESIPPISDVKTRTSGFFSEEVGPRSSQAETSDRLENAEHTFAPIFSSREANAAQTETVSQSNPETPRTSDSILADHTSSLRGDLLRSPNLYPSFFSAARHSQYTSSHMTGREETALSRGRAEELEHAMAREPRNISNSQRFRYVEEMIRNELNESGNLRAFFPLIDYGSLHIKGRDVKMAHPTAKISTQTKKVIIPGARGGHPKRDGRLAKLSLAVYNTLKKEGVKSIAAAPCRQAIPWLPEVLKRLETEMYGLQFYCIDTDGSETEMESMKTAFNGVSSLRFGGFLSTKPEHIEAVMPRNLDLVVSWFGIEEWGIRKTLRFLKGFRRSGVRKALFSTTCTSIDEELEENHKRNGVIERDSDECGRIVVYSLRE